MIFKYDYMASSGVFTHSSSDKVDAETKHEATLIIIAKAKKEFKKAWPTINNEPEIKIDFK